MRIDLTAVPQLSTIKAGVEDMAEAWIGGCPQFRFNHVNTKWQDSRTLGCDGRVINVAWFVDQDDVACGRVGVTIGDTWAEIIAQLFEQVGERIHAQGKTDGAHEVRAEMRRVMGIFDGLY